MCCFDAQYVDVAQKNEQKGDQLILQKWPNLTPSCLLIFQATTIYCTSKEHIVDIEFKFRKQNYI